MVFIPCLEVGFRAHLDFSGDESLSFQVESMYLSECYMLQRKMLCNERNVLFFRRVYLPSSRCRDVLFRCSRVPSFQLYCPNTVPALFRICYPLFLPVLFSGFLAESHLIVCPLDAAVKQQVPMSRSQKPTPGPYIPTFLSPH